VVVVRRHVEPAVQSVVAAAAGQDELRAVSSAECLRASQSDAGLLSARRDSGTRERRE